MGMRPRQHVLEELSRRAFHAAFPAEWVVRDQDQDYGLDAQVQPFEYEEPACPPFFAQLKATDSGQGDSTGVTVKLATERLRQYLEAPHPVMLVGFHAPTGGIFFAWAHRLLHRLSEDERSMWRYQKTVSLRLELSLTPAKAAEFLEDVRQFFRIRGGVPRPPTVRLRLTLPPADASRSSAVLDSLAAWVSGAQSRVQLESEEAEVCLDVTDDWAHVRLRYSSMDVTLPSFLPHPPEVDEAAALVKVVAAIALSMAGLHRDAAALLVDAISAHARPDGVLEHVLGLPVVWGVLVTANASHEAFSAAETLVAQGLSSYALLAAAAGRAALLPQAEAQRYTGEQRYRSILKSLLEQERAPECIGTLHYNLANSLRETGFYRQAVTHYLAAAEHAPDYLARDYWWREAGGALLLRNCLRLARAYYEYACLLSEDRLPTGLLADTLFRLRRFDAADELFSKWFVNNAELDEDLLLRHLIVSTLQDEFGSGPRRIGLAHRQAVAAYKIKDPELQYQALHEALKLDPLCEYAWNNYAALRSTRQPEHTADWWLIAATLTGWWDVETCVRAIAALEKVELQIARFAKLALVTLAVRHHGERFFLEVPRVVTAQPGQRPIREYVQHLRKVAETARDFFGGGRQAMTLRVL
ncbi:DUF4365 domain-containing protein [Pyxidicoccus xibeiensis]|uniref:DUF4365 domain-containing protein n=1 Tax=Pyxidicoccus xibeiensis TaxID=2906759 RepID=UPI0020A74A0C|nr:DUF4365 domain-containing protein [Pyxidicoccus xibeiensis]MCP3143603.1 DUF4365 domain-containing protein [Pyxidicoccus xibeiensis]